MRDGQALSWLSFEVMRKAGKSERFFFFLFKLLSAELLFELFPAQFPMLLEDE